MQASNFTVTTLTLLQLFTLIFLFLFNFSYWKKVIHDEQLNASIHQVPVTYTIVVILQDYSNADISKGLVTITSHIGVFNCEGSKSGYTQFFNILEKGILPNCNHWRPLLIKGSTSSWEKEHLKSNIGPVSQHEQHRYLERTLLLVYIQ